MFQLFEGLIIKFVGYQGSAEAVFHHPRHPYSMGLLRSVPRLDRPRGARLETIEGLVPNLANAPPGCRFAPRCRHGFFHTLPHTVPFLFDRDMKLLPREQWTLFSNRLIWHGRRVCMAKNPDHAGGVLARAGRAMLFGAQQVFAQHRGLWDLLEARASARSRS